MNTKPMADEVNWKSPPSLNTPTPETTLSTGSEQTSSPTLRSGTQRVSQHKFPETSATSSVTFGVQFSRTCPYAQGPTPPSHPHLNHLWVSHTLSTFQVAHTPTVHTPITQLSEHTQYMYPLSALHFPHFHAPAHQVTSHWDYPSPRLLL